MNYSVHELGNCYAREVIDILNQHNEENECTLLPGALPLLYYSVIQQGSVGLPGFALTEDGRAIGFAYCTPFHEASALNTMEAHCYVHSGYRRNCLGSVLMDAMVGNLRRIGVTGLMARLPSTNVGGLAFLVRNGFSEVARIPGLVATQRKARISSIFCSGWEKTTRVALTRACRPPPEDARIKTHGINDRTCFRKTW